MNETALEDYDERLYNISLEDERSQINTFYTSIGGSVTTVVTGTLSSLSSLLVIGILLKSSRGLQTVYNRIIFGMSISTLLMSIAMAFNTLPMPTDMIYHQFQGIVLGNSYSCTAQGFFMSFGAACSTMYCASLLVYYLFSIRKKKTDVQISKCLEPVLHVTSIVYSLAYALSLLVFEAYNPTPLDAWCTFRTYPWWCTNDRDKPCLIRAKRESYAVYLALAGSSIVILLVMVSSLVLVGLEIHSERRVVELFLKRFKSHDLPPTKALQEDLARHKHMLQQCFVYFFVYLAVLIFPIFIMIDGSSRASNYGISVAHLVIRPLQGFFHMMIFMQHKVYNLRLAYPTISFCHAIEKVLKAQEEPEHIICSLDIVNADINQIKEQEASVPNSSRENVAFVDDTVSKSAVQDLNMLNISIDLSLAKDSASRSAGLSGFDLSYDSSHLT